MSGFPAATLEFLKDLRANNTKAWFDANRDRYESSYVAPAKAFIDELAPGLDGLVPGIRTEPKVNGSLFRINRDVRFSSDKRPYKDHLDMWFWEGDRKTAPSGLFFRVAPETVIVGAGNHAFTREQLACYRAAVDDDLSAVVEHLDRAGYQIGGQTYARVPGGRDVDERTARLLKHSSLHAFIELPARKATSRSLSGDSLEHWKRLAPLHRWLMTAIG